MNATSIMPACRHRGRAVAADRWMCSSSRLVIPGRVVPGAVCRHSCPSVDHACDPPVAAKHAEQQECGTGQSVSPEISVESMIDAIRLDHPKPLTWPWWQVAQCAHRQMFNDAARAVSPYPGGCEGRGIVMAAGGSLYFACAYISVYVLRALGCTLPVEFWHLGPGEIDAHMAASVEPLGVTCIDARAIKPQPRRLNGWELKPFAILHSRFEQVLFMDADNIAVRDPTYLFDDAQFTSSGAIFWPDLPQSVSPQTWIPQRTWDIADIAWRDGPPFESGQLLIDKRACWRELMLTMHLNEHSDFWYRYVYGDKDTFKLAWHKLETRYGMPATDAGWQWPAILQHDLAGNPVFSHACQGKRQLIAGEPLAALPTGSIAREAAQAYMKLSR